MPRIGLHKILVGDCRKVLKTLPDESVHCVVTSPPYWGLRQYPTEHQVWGGDPECEHVWQEVVTNRPNQSGGDTPKQTTNKGSYVVAYDNRATASNTCARCNAWRGHLGLEPTPEAFVANILEVFREVYRVLRKDGTAWVNLGDSFFSQGGTGQSRHWDGRNKNTETQSIRPHIPPGLKPKDLVGIPWAVAFALRADGWYLRSAIIWHKPNPMPESVTDRPTKAHEQLFLMSKSQKYFYDAEAIKEPNSEGSIKRFRLTENGQQATWNTTNNKRDSRDDGTKSSAAFRNHVPIDRNARSVWTIDDPYELHRWIAANHPELMQEFLTPDCPDVWKIPTQPYREAHFATFPELLVRDPIKAGTSEKGCCTACGTPLRRVPKTERWRFNCDCDDRGIMPCTVLDPFCGSGTVLQVANTLGRRSIGIELSQEYVPLIHKRANTPSKKVLDNGKSKRDNPRSRTA